MNAEELGLVFKALDFAASKHRDQRRKGQEAAPYINHPIALSHLLWNVGKVEDPLVIMGALLHDTLEDTDTTFEELEQEFSIEVATLVQEVTDDKGLSKPERKQMQVERAATVSPEAKLIKLADKIANFRDILASPPHNWSQDKKWEYFQWGKQVIEELRGTHLGLERMFDHLYEEGQEKFAP